MASLLKIWVATTVCLTLCVSAAVGSGFCYDDAEGCGPSTAEWTGVCHSGKRQSPIDLPLIDLNPGLTKLRLNSYRGNPFRMTNNGHSVAIDFLGQGPSATPFQFPDAVSVNRFNQDMHNYTFSGAHFHWGKSDVDGTEHCLAGPLGVLRECFAMELHLVHYMSNYSSQADAAASGNPNALAVLGIMLKANYFDFDLFSTHPVTRIANHVKQVSAVNSAVTVNEELDFSSLLKVIPAVYSYKGSLTTPGCNEQVNWFVSRNPALVPSRDIKAFRESLIDAHGRRMDINRRPTQPLNGRTVYLSEVVRA